MKNILFFFLLFSFGMLAQTSTTDFKSIDVEDTLKKENINKKENTNSIKIANKRKGYTGYNPFNEIWRSGNCDGDTDDNGTEYDCGTDPYDDTDSCTLNIIDFESHNFVLYPNPTTGMVFINTPKTIKEVFVHTLERQLVLKFNSNELDLRDIASGMYLVSIFAEDGSFTVKKLIKK